MTEHLARYRRLELHLWMTRWRNEERESAEEDSILDEMDAAWMKLTEDERCVLRLEGPRCWPIEAALWPPEIREALDDSAPTAWEYDGFHSPSEAIPSADAA